MILEVVFIQVGVLVDGFVLYGNLLVIVSLFVGENFIFYVVGSELQQLVIEDEQMLSWNGKCVFWWVIVLCLDILFIDFFDLEWDNVSISVVCNLMQCNVMLVYGQLLDEVVVWLDVFSWVE